MDRNIQRFPNPETQNIHEFLTKLNECPATATEATISEIAKKCFNLGKVGSFFFDARDQIVDSVDILMKEVVHMPSFSDAQNEIFGAINGLNLLLKHETSESKQKEIHQSIQQMSLNIQYIKDIFLLKEAIQNKSEFSSLIFDPQFVAGFGMLRFLFGRKRKMELPLIHSFMRVWMNPELQPLLKDFLTTGVIARKINLEKLQNNMIPLIENPHNHNAILAHSTLKQEAIPELEKEEMQTFKKLIDDILNSRVLVTNTQMHTDGLFLTFNSDVKDPVSQRLKSNIAHHENVDRERLAELKKATEDPALDQEQIKKEIELLQKLEGYHPRPGGFIYEKTTWSPVIGQNDPICKLTHTIGFATSEGNKNESQTVLDFTKALGAENLLLSVEEKELLSRLLLACDRVALGEIKHANAWFKSKELPKEVGAILKQFDNEKYPHLRSLSVEQKEMLVSEALRFSLIVNLNLAKDLLNL